MSYRDRINADGPKKILALDGGGEIFKGRKFRHIVMP